MAKAKKRSDGNYQRSVMIGRNADGTLKRKVIYAKTQKELDEKVAELIQQIKMGTLSADEYATFGSLAETWLESYKPTISEKMRLCYRGILNAHLKGLYSLKAKELKPMHLQTIINGMAKEGYAQKTMQMVKQAASQVMELALQNDIVYRNVFAKIKVPHVESEERQPLTPEQRELILRTWRGNRMGVPVLIMLYCGLRRGEMLALTWNDVDLTNKTVSVTKAADFPRNATSIKKPKTKAGIRTVPIPDAILPALRQARAETDSLYVCPAVKTGGIMSGQAYSEAWKSYMHYLNIQAGGCDKTRTKNEKGKATFTPEVIAIQKFTAHQLRHTYATMLYDAGVDIKSAQKLLGHADIQVTMKIYTHLSVEKEQQAIDDLNKHVNATLGSRIQKQVEQDLER